jgi:hypothetical protein
MSVELDHELFAMETLLRRAAGTLSYPPTPAISAAVRARLQERRSLAERTKSGLVALWVRPVARQVLALLFIAAVLVGAALAVPRSRSALADFFHLSHVQVEREPTSGPTPPVLSPETFASPSTIDEAQQAIDFPLRLPSSAGLQLLPDAVYLQGEGSGMPTVIFVYEDRGYDLYETRLSYFGKGVDPALVHNIEFGGQPAYWIDQGGHIASFLDEQGRVVVESRRSVDRATLLWERDGITYRLETSLSQEDAMRVAESLR